jgi:hypothetical protein
MAHYLQELDDYLEKLSDKDLLALHNEQNDETSELQPTTPLRKKLYNRWRTQLIDCEIDFEIQRRWCKSVESKSSARKKKKV